VQGAWLATLTLLAASAAQASDCDPELFRVGRSTNTNVVVYLANLAQDGGLDARRPVSAEWILLAGDGGREPLTPMEESLAYGFEVRPADPLDGFWVTLRARPDRPIRVHLRDGCPRATAGIAGGESRLRLIFVETEPAFLFPRVRAIRLEGVDEQTGEPVRERIPVR
jgi:hypothetical protein